jgi:hypothetical protein
MTRLVVICVLASFAVAGCATTEDYALKGPHKFRRLNCGQLEAKRVVTEKKTVALFTSLSKRKAFGDRAKADVLVLWPTLLFLKGPNSADGKAYALLKDDYEAVRFAATEKGCGLDLRGDVSQAVLGDAKSPQARTINTIVGGEVRRD